MSVKRATTLFTAVVVALVLPALALAAPARPQAGKWKTDGGGGFSVSNNQKSVFGLHLSAVSCGLGLKQVSVTGSQALRLIGGSGGPSWGVGFADPSRKNPNDVSGVVGQKVTIRSGSQKLPARLDIIFGVGGTRATAGDLKIKGCYLSFFAHR